LKIVVTGGAGFIGSWVVRKAAAMGHEVVVVDRLARGRAAPLPPGTPLIAMDIRHPDRIAPAVGSADAVLHLAADASVPHGEAAPLLMAEDNLAGTAGALDLAERVGAREFRFASSAAVYGDPGPTLPISESAPTNPLSFYGWSKYAGEQWCRRFAATRGMGLVILRPGNVYGPGQDDSGEGGVVARFCERLRADEPLVREGTGEQVRDFIYVDDVASAFLHRLGEWPAEAAVFNLGTGEGVSINRLGAALAAIADKPLRWTGAPARAGDIFASVFDPARAGQWGFSPRVTLEEGLRATWTHSALPA
jgi:UDP-glucose 4-epimerase